MPGVSIQPSTDDVSISDIKKQAKAAVKEQAQGASALALISTARTQYLKAGECESNGDLKGALSGLVKAASLAQAVFNTKEYSNGNDAVKKGLGEMLETGGLTERLKAVEEKLKALEQSPTPSIADRLRSLQSNGLAIQTSSKRVSHSFVSPSSLGPPSPTSSPSSSPTIPNYSVSEFKSQFPSIDELDELAVPSAPVLSPIPSTLLSFDPLERPSSTPITHVTNSFSSRPASPAKSTPIPHKNTATPKELAAYLRDPKLKVLLLDVRNRGDFDKERIKTSAPVVCVEPSVLMREDLTAQKIEDSMVIAPTSESTSFGNRNKFDLVVIYDANSETYTGPLNVLQQAVVEKEFKKPLRRMPMLLVGGLDAWKTEGEPTTSNAEGSTPPTTSPSPMKNPFALGGVLASGSTTTTASGGEQYWTPAPATIPTTTPATSPSRTRADTASAASPSILSLQNQHRTNQSLDFGHARSPAESGGGARRPVIPTRGTSSTTTTTASTSIQYPFFSTTSRTPNNNTNNNSNGFASSSASPSASPFASTSTLVSPPSQFDNITSPPQASINPSLHRRRSDYIDQSQEALSGYHVHSRSPIEYPELAIRPPPLALAASSALGERQRPLTGLTEPNGNLNGTSTSTSTSTITTSSSTHPHLPLTPPVPPRIPSSYPIHYWLDSSIGVSGLKNLGNTCYMNAPIQCLSATAPFASFFLEGKWKNAVNMQNKMGSRGALTGGFANLLRMMWSGDLPFITPLDFRKTVCSLNSQYLGTDQHDSQEFLSFLLDGIHEDLNRILVRPNVVKTPEDEEKLEKLAPQIASEQEWKLWRDSHDSVIVDFFQGQFRNQLKCITCQKTSTTYNAFSILSVPIPHGRSGKVPLQRCLDAFFNTEILEKDDAWDCPQCKTKRPATKQLSLARLPPILLIHLKRFEANGRFSDKIDTFVEFPTKGLDMTGFMPPPIPVGADQKAYGTFGGVGGATYGMNGLNGGSGYGLNGTSVNGTGGGSMPMSADDPRMQVPPYRYDLYGVTNHVGNLSSGHYTAFVASRGGWMYCDDSVIKSVDSKQVVSQKAYVLFYKRTKA